MTRRLVLSYLAVTAVVLVMLEVPFGLVYQRREVERLTAAAERDAAVVASVYEDALEADGALDPLPAQRYERRAGARVVVVDRDGIARVDTGGATPRDFSTRPEIEAALVGSRASGVRRSTTLDTQLLYVAVPVASGGEVHGAVRLTMDMSDVDHEVREFWGALAVIAVVVLAVMGLLGRIAARSVTQPLRRINDAARRFGRGDLSTPPESGAALPELRDLDATMTTMARQLASILDEQRAFVADASHQLRTPLTGLRLRLENLRARSSDTDAEEIDAAIDEIARLGALVSDLLQMARADQPGEPTPSDLTALAGERVDTWQAVAEVAGVGIALVAEGPPVVAMAVPGAVEQILDNLLDNAVDLSPAGGTVTVEVTVGPAEARAGGQWDGRDVAVLSVTDQGPGLSDEDKDRAVRRFWRGDPTRAGSGLGLAIASRLAEASGGRLVLSDAPGGGLRVAVELPSASS